MDQAAPDAGDGSSSDETPQEGSPRRLVGEPDYICMDWSERSFGNKVARAFYKAMRVVFASVWFYYIPFTSILLSYSVPHFFGEDPVTNAANIQTA